MYHIIKEHRTGCGRCFDICPNQAIFLVDKVAQIDYDKCNDCGKCLEVCQSHAVAEIVNTLQKSKSAVCATEKAFVQSPAKVWDSSKYPLLIGALDLVGKIAGILIENYNKPVPTHSSTNSLPSPKAPLGSSSRRRRRRQGWSGK